MKSLLKKFAVVSAIVAGTLYPAAAADLKVALVLPGAITDQAANQQYYEGLAKSQAKGELEFAYTEMVGQAAQAEVMLDYARRGYDVIFAGGGQFIDAAKQVKSQFPEVKVIVANGQESEGITTASFRHNEFGFIAGLVAGGATKSGIIGGLAGQPIPAWDEVLKAFTEGARVTRPDVKVLSSTTGDWGDVARAKGAAAALIAQGADVLIAYLDGGANGVLQAAKDGNVHTVSITADLSLKDPQTNLFSAVEDYGVMTFKLIEDAKVGKLEPKNYTFGIVDGVLGKFNESVPEQIQQEVAKKIEELKAASVN